MCSHKKIQQIWRIIETVNVFKPWRTVSTLSYGYENVNENTDENMKAM